MPYLVRHHLTCIALSTAFLCSTVIFYSLALLFTLIALIFRHSEDGESGSITLADDFLLAQPLEVHEPPSGYCVASLAALLGYWRILDATAKLVELDLVRMTCDGNRVDAGLPQRYSYG